MTSMTSSITRGFCVCLPSGSVLGRTYRGTPEEAVTVIAGTTKFADDFWEEKKRLGWSVKPVVAFIDLTPAAAQEAAAAAGEPDDTLADIAEENEAWRENEFNSPGPEDDA